MTAPQRPARSGPLVGVKVLDLSVALMGPYAGQILADLGADVIKVEGPERDTSRFLGPGTHADRGGMFVNMNRGKRAIGLDLKHPDGRAALLRLAADADVFLHAMRRSALERLGLGYADVAAVNPGIVHVSLVGFGAGGPYADLPAYDDVMQAASGLAMLQGQLQGRDPEYLATVVCDKTGGLTAVYATIAALFHRERTGEGQAVEVPMFETMASWVMVEHIVGALYDPPLGPPEYARVLSPDRRPYCTSDGHIAVMVYNDGQWRRFFAAIGDPEWSRDPRFATMRSRTEHVDFVLGCLARELEGRTTAEWLEVLRAAEVPAMPLQTTQDLLHDEHLEAVGFWERMDVDGEQLRFPGIPTSFSRTPGRVTAPGPGFGQHSREVLTEHGFTGAEIDALLAAGALLEGRDE